MENQNQLKDALAEVVRKAISLAEKTGEFVMEQAPELIQEFLTWKLYENIFIAAICIAVIIMARYLPTLWLSKDKPNIGYLTVRFFNLYGEEGALVSLMVFISATVLATPFLIVSILDIIKIVVAPKIYLIEYFLK